MSAVLLDDVKTFLNRTDNSDDDELLAMIDRAEAILAVRVGPLEPTIVVDEVHWGHGPILLRKWPVLSVTSATSNGVPVADLQLDVQTGVLYGTFACAYRYATTTVTYTAGREWLTADLQAAILELVRHLWLTQRVPGTRRGFSAGEPDERTVQGISNYLLPYRVQTLIEPYLQPRIA
ncbi:MAG: hypothetical protein HOV76_32370 [Hamadaea sp.]|nr:hypothetical protein [Catenulispora sp.]NUT08173.1 hypothetical protein [Hamadaea sp.]